MHESKSAKNKFYEKIFDLLNTKLIVRNSNDLYMNFYAYHFLDSLVKVLGSVFIAREN